MYTCTHSFNMYSQLQHVFTASTCTHSFRHVLTASDCTHSFNMYSQLQHVFTASTCTHNHSFRLHSQLQHVFTASTCTHSFNMYSQLQHVLTATASDYLKSEKFILHMNIDHTLPNNKHGPTHYKLGVTCVYNVFYTRL